jgi:hypothetical protein
MVPSEVCAASGAARPGANITASAKERVRVTDRERIIKPPGEQQRGETNLTGDQLPDVHSFKSTAFHLLSWH